MEDAVEDAIEREAEGARVEIGPKVQAYWDAYAKVAGVTAPFEPWWFGSEDDPEQLTSLGRLVSDGPKRATTAILAHYEAEGEPLPVGGEFGVVVDGEGTPLCIVRMTRVDVVAFGDVTEEFAWVEGEGDRSLAYWRAAHIRFFQGLGTPLDDSTPMVLQRFDVVWPTRD